MHTKQEPVDILNLLRYTVLFTAICLCPLRSGEALNGAHI